MKDGYYLATYLTPPGLSCIAGDWVRHDNNISLWKLAGSELTLCRYWELERLTGVKEEGTAALERSGALALIRRCLETEGVRLDEIVEIWGTPAIETVSDYHFVDDFPDLAYHSVSHLFSAILLRSDLFWTEPILGLALDAGPDPVLERGSKPNWYAGAVVRGGDLRTFPVESPGVLWLQANRQFGMREGSLMALATASDACVEIDRDRILKEFTFYGPGVRFAGPAAFDSVIRLVKSALENGAHGGLADADSRFSARENFISAVMKEIQALSIAIMERNVDRIVAEHSLDPTKTHLALAGGYALNCPSNSRLVLRYGFKSLLAPPCVSDCGQSLGIALGAFYKKLRGRPFSFTFPGPYLGVEDKDFDGCAHKYRSFIKEVAPLRIEQIAEDLERGPVVWLSGRAEIGPRALGNRSILGDPRTLKTKAVLNELKQREWWRPVAPVVMEEHLAEWFEDSRPSPYMLETFVVRSARRGRVPAIAHLDSSARVQSLSRDQNPLLHQVVAGFNERTGVPMLCNTSLNDKGEPIVNNLEQAVNFCLRKKIPVAYLDRRRVSFCNFDAYQVRTPLARQPIVSAEDNVRVEAARMHLAALGLNEKHLHEYLWNPDIRRGFEMLADDYAQELRGFLDKAEWPGGTSSYEA
jgi:carbamoyltransferase